MQHKNLKKAKLIIDCIAKELRLERERQNKSQRYWLMNMKFKNR